MAGVVPSRRSTSGRKQWSIQDGARCSLKRLRSELANDGCPESQVVLAKQLLEDRCDYQAEDKRENARLGVYWLIKASEQGNTEATDLLKKCLESGKGITEQNYLDVEACISITQDEKIAKRAARKMFASLSNGEEYITSEQLQKRMLAIEHEQGECSYSKASLDDRGDYSNGELVNNEDFASSSESDEEIDWTNRSNFNNEKLTEDHLVAAAVNYAHGEIPRVNRVLCLSQPSPHALDHLPLMQRPILHPLLAIQILYYKLIEFLATFVFLPKSETQLLVFLFIYSWMGTTESIVYFVPILLYFVTFVVMIVTTFRMLYTKREFYDFRLWSGLFLTYSGGSLNAEEAEIRYITNHLKPCWQFFIALLINLMLYPVIVERYIPQSEMTVVAFLLTFMTLFGFMYKKRSKIVYDYLVLLSFAINVLAKYPYDTDPVVTQGWRFLDLKIPTFATYVIGNGIEFCIHFRVLLYAFIPVLLLKLASRKKWRGIYMYFIPHCVTLSWLQLVVISSQGATMFGLLRGTLALVGVVLFLPLVGLTTIFLPAAAMAKWLVATNFIYTIGLFIFLTASGILFCKLLSKTQFKNLTPIFQIVFSAVSIYFLLNSIIENDFINKLSVPKDVKPLDYEIYHKFCQQQSWDTENTVSSQMRCSQLENFEVHWDGYLNNINLKSTTNNLKYFIDKFPVFIANNLYCYYGEEITEQCDRLKHTEEDCRIFYEIVKSKTPCTLDRFNKYTFEITLRMQSGLWSGGDEIVLIATDHFKNFTSALQLNDHLWFKGRLKANHYVILQEIGCLACRDMQLTEVKLSTQKTGWTLQEILSIFYSGVKSVLNFMFNPVVVFK
ncbi:wolframin [Onthophagus taurus]|uniref:wolframin n=1 Tax=Onthophagus taurus TaxID=166361 RepID=UPI000C208060|nr:wolframin [Onthophagus taurus]